MSLKPELWRPVDKTFFDAPAVHAVTWGAMIDQQRGRLERVGWRGGGGGPVKGGRGKGLGGGGRAGSGECGHARTGSRECGHARTHTTQVCSTALTW